jgi:hypothetical protein
MPKRISSQPSTDASRIRPGGGAVIRPMYGVVIRDSLSKFRRELQVTIDDTKQAIADGKPKAKEVFGDGVLQGSELTKAKNALKDLEKAIKHLKPVFPGLGDAPARGGADTRRDLGREPGRIVPMYGVVFRDDLSRFRDQIGSVVRDIKAGMSSLKPNEQTEAKKALTSLQAALKDLGVAQRNWN